MRLETFRLLTALATKLGLLIHVVDVVGAYLNGTLQETIYMEQPPDYDDGTGRVSLLIKALYGLKQAGRTWNKVELRFLDMTFIAIKKAKAELGQHFTITDLGEAKQIVGLELQRNLKEGTLKLSQTQYIQRTLEKFGMADSHPVNTLMDPNVKLIKLPDTENYDIPDYRSAIGSLMYAAIGTRPDISFAVQHLSQFMSNPGPAHWTAVKRVFRYLNGTRSLGITFHKGGEVEPLAYSDADWGSDQNDRKSISGYVFIMSAGPISWQSKKQPTIALSSMEAEYMAESLATRQIIWL